MDTPKKFVIDRARWRSGCEGPTKTGEGRTKLLNNYGCMCCLGFISQQCGIPNEELDGYELPSETGIEFFLTYNAGYAILDRVLAKQAININDDEFMPREAKEKRLKNLFAGAGYEIEFIGEYPT